MAKDVKLFIVPKEVLIEKIYVFRGQKVMLDTDLADLYGVETKRLKEQVKRNIERFPERYMFQLSQEEAEASRSQFATLKNCQTTQFTRGLQEKEN